MSDRVYFDVYSEVTGKCSRNTDANEDHSCAIGSLIPAAATTDKDSDAEANCCEVTGKCSGSTDANEDHSCAIGSLIPAATTTDKERAMTTEQ